MLFNNNQLNELFEIIDSYHTIFIATNIGESVLTNNDKKLLKENGIKLDNLPKQTLLDRSFHFGVLSEALGDKNTKGLNYNDFKDYLKRGNFIPLTNDELNALNKVKLQAYSDIKNLGNKIEREIAQKNIESASFNAIKQRYSKKELSNDLSKKLNDWNRDFDRVADYIMNCSYQEGRAQSLINLYGEDVEVYKEVMPVGACKHCIRLYLTNGLGSQPRIFKLKDLIANGTNIGKKVGDWKAVLGSLHPYCRCQLKIVPANFIWDKEKKDFILPKVWTRRVERRSKIKITIGNKNYEV